MTEVWKEGHQAMLRGSAERKDRSDGCERGMREDGGGGKEGGEGEVSGEGEREGGASPGDVEAIVYACGMASSGFFWLLDSAPYHARWHRVERQRTDSEEGRGHTNDRPQTVADTTSREKRGGVNDERDNTT